MSGLSFTVNEQGLGAVARQVDPKQVYTILVTWYDRATKVMASELRARTPSRIRGKVRVKIDGYRPPRFARIDVNSPLAHLVEGGVGPAGDPRFNHVSEFFPQVSGPGGLADVMGIPVQQAFAVASAISNAGGVRAKPFVKPAFQSGRPKVEALMETIIKEVMGP